MEGPTVAVERSTDVENCLTTQGNGRILQLKDLWAGESRGERLGVDKHEGLSQSLQVFFPPLIPGPEKASAKARNAVDKHTSRVLPGGLSPDSNSFQRLPATGCAQIWCGKGSFSV